MGGQALSPPVRASRSRDGIPVTEAAKRAGVSYRTLDHWCRSGLFGVDRVGGTGSGTRRPAFTPADVALAVVLDRVASAARMLANSPGARMEALAVVADQVRSGADVVRVRLGDHVELTVDVADLRAEVGE